MIATGFRELMELFVDGKTVDVATGDGLAMAWRAGARTGGRAVRGSGGGGHIDNGDMHALKQPEFETTRALAGADVHLVMRWVVCGCGHACARFPEASIGHKAANTNVHRCQEMNHTPA